MPDRGLRIPHPVYQFFARKLSGRCGPPGSADVEHGDIEMFRAMLVVSKTSDSVYYKARSQTVIEMRTWRRWIGVESSKCLFGSVAPSYSVRDAERWGRHCGTPMTRARVAKKVFAAQDRKTAQSIDTANLKLHISVRRSLLTPPIYKHNSASTTTHLYSRARSFHTHKMPSIEHPTIKGKT